MKDEKPDAETGRHGDAGKEIKLARDIPVSPRLPIPLSVFYPSSFRLHTSSFLLVSTKKLLNVLVGGPAQAFVSAAENDVSFAHHHHLAVD